MTKATTDPALDVKGKHRLPRYPRIIVGGYSIVPAVDDHWQVLHGLWMVPGRKYPMTTDQVKELAAKNDQLFHILRR